MATGRCDVIHRRWRSSALGWITTLWFGVAAAQGVTPEAAAARPAGQVPSAAATLDAAATASAPATPPPPLLPPLTEPRPPHLGEKRWEAMQRAPFVGVEQTRAQLERLALLMQAFDWCLNPQLSDAAIETLLSRLSPLMGPLDCETVVRELNERSSIGAASKTDEGALPRR